MTTERRTHTPGPWTVDHNDTLDQIRIRREGVTAPIAYAPCYVPSYAKSGRLEEIKANFALMAAAPLLLAACLKAVGIIEVAAAEDNTGNISECHQMLEAAIDAAFSN